MNTPRPAELARRLFGSVRRERPGAELRARILAQGRAELERARDARAIDPLRPPEEMRAPLAPGRTRPEWLSGTGRRVALGALATAAAAVAYLGTTRTPDRDVLISAERSGSARSARGSGELAAPVPRAPRSVGPDPATPSAHELAPVAPGQLFAPTARPPAPPPPKAATPAPDAAPRASLGEQLEQIKRARVTLRGGDPRQALALLDAYLAQSSGDGLAAEASLLRIEALASSGQQDAATRAARQFAIDYPNSPLIDRAQSYAEPDRR